MQGVRASFFRFGVVTALFLSPLAGCATVSVMEPKALTAQIAIAPQSSQLHNASDAYCDAARRSALATGETSIGSLASLLTGRGGADDAYWKKISLDTKATPASLLARIRTDAGAATKGLGDLSVIAQKLMSASRPSKSDVADFERALIHARQARASFAEALVQAARRASQEYETTKELDGLDKALASARIVADDLAAARLSDMAGLGAFSPIAG